MLMIMKSNSKKCSTMRKFITTMLIAAAAFTACVQNDEVVVPNNNDKITFTATVTAPESRTVLVQDDADTYHAEWAEGDAIKIYAIATPGEGSNTRIKLGSAYVEIPTAGKAATVTAEFELEEIDEEGGIQKYIDEAEKFYYVMGSPCLSVDGAAKVTAFKLPTAQTPITMDSLDANADVFVSQVVECTTQPTESVTFETTRISSIAKVSVKVPTALASGDAVKSVTFACDNDIAGQYRLKWDSVKANNPLQDKGTKDLAKTITVTLPTAQNVDFSYYMGLWGTTLAKDSKVTVTLLTNNDKMYIKTVTLTEDLVFTTGDMTTLTVNMSKVQEYVEQTYEPIEGTVNVAGIYWALGNLEYEVDGTTDTGFAAGWRIAPTQYHFFYMPSEGNTDGHNTSISNYNKVAHFNFGGIPFGEEINPFSTSHKSALHIAGPTGEDSAFDFSGKMFTDATCTTPAGSWADAQYGDIAYWASKGQYRMPTAAEFEALYTKACYTLATYNDGTNTIYGSYFYNPAKGQLAGKVEGTKELIADDLETGLFLPWSGRTYNNTDYNIYNITKQGYYRTSTVESNSKVEQGYGVIYRVNDFTILSNTGTKSVTDIDGTKKTTYNFGATSRYAIRPVYIAE